MANQTIIMGRRPHKWKAGMQSVAVYVAAACSRCCHCLPATQLRSPWPGRGLLADDVSSCVAVAVLVAAALADDVPALYACDGLGGRAMADGILASATAARSAAATQGRR